MMKVIGLLLMSSSAFAAGGGAGGHISDLLVPACNFGILFAFLFIKLRKPLSEGFTKKSEDVASLYNSAELKDKEAQLKLDAVEKKLSTVASKKEQILADATKDGEKFEASHSKETADAITRYRTDSEAKVEHEKVTGLKKINESLLDEVIAKTKSAIKSDKSSQSKITGNLVSSIK